MTISIAPLLAGARSSIAAALADQQRRDRATGAATWRDPRVLGDALRLPWVRIDVEVRRAEALGLIETRELEAGPRIALTDLGWKLFGLDVPAIPAKGVLSDNTLEESDGPAELVRGADSSGTPDEPEPPSSRPTLIQVLIHWRSAVALVQELADHLGRDAEPVWDEVLEAEAEGLVETWPDHPAGPAVMLSSLEAGRLRLHLSGDGTRWLRPWEPDPTGIDPALGIFRESDYSHDPDEAGLFDRMADPDAPGGDEAALEGEHADQAVESILDRLTDPGGPGVTVVDRQIESKDAWELAGRGVPVVRLPPPRIVLGLGLAWPVEVVPGEVCPGCRDARLGIRTYCLVCHRSGLDDLIRYLLSQERHRSGPRVRTGSQPAKPGRAERRRHVETRDWPGLRGGLGS